MEEKKYSIVGKVEIGTDEYRDLIETNAELKAEKDKRFSMYWEEHTRANNLENDLKNTREKLEVFQGFLDSNEEIRAKYRLYLVERQLSTEGGKNE